jgi:hypothetical protein
MDIDENDILFTNQYIKTKDIHSDVSSQKSNEFKQFRLDRLEQ